MHSRGFVVGNVDAVVIAESPKLGPYLERIVETLAGTLGAAPSDVSVQGKTNEGLDAVGREEGIAVHAVALLAPAPPGGDVEVVRSAEA